ncbi:hypothetical protein DM01DRAFT_1035720 [Hesseltinella vesiculosa]|uniref:Inhibitor I9 domain-containing protein n=1 Tax=Hesseltinella vesiculosa TaxID=101127 RepID=A0A1X2GID3_9FUNG|nr:hypothetical protein DM01DRAFT_1035720 [Hesseltinella vesiculosa]
MRLFTAVASALVLLTAVAVADNTYIVALKKNADTEDVAQAKTDIQSMGGKVLYQFKTGVKGFIVSLPEDQFNTLDEKDYIDFIEADQEVHI